MMNNPLTRNKYISAFKNDIRLILTMTGLSLLLGVAYILLAYKPTYQSQASVLIKDAGVDSYVISDMGGGKSQLKAVKPDGDPILTQKEILKSERLAENLERYIKTRYPKEYKEGMEIDKLIKVKNPVGTDILNVSFNWGERERARELLNKLIADYDAINLNINRKIQTTRRDYIDTRVEEIGRKLSEVRNKIRRYKASTLAISLDDESRELVTQKTLFSTQMENTQSAIDGMRQTVRELQSQLALSPRQALNAVALGSGNKNLTELRSNLSLAQQEYQANSEKLADTNPKMIALRAKIDTIQAQINENAKLTLGRAGGSHRVILDPVREKLAQDLVDSQVKLRSLVAQKAALQGSIGRINANQAKIPDYAYELDTLQQQERSLSKALDALTEKQIEANIKEAEIVSNIYVIDTPSLAKSPNSPKPVHILFFSLLLGLGLGFGASLLKNEMLVLVLHDGKEGRGVRGEALSPG